jgi:energy-coupling factor transport system substrate-specific component
MFSGCFGLLFGAICTIPYIFVTAFSSGLPTGIKLGIAWWIAGIPWDIVHCVSNFVFMLVLYEPITRVINKLKSMNK